ncbi:hypothetical protein PRIC1_007069 [Phytophthora ramorum]
MRFTYLVLAAAAVLLAGSNTVSASDQKNIGEVTSANAVASVRALAADVESTRRLRADKSVGKEDDENAKDGSEEKGLFDYLVNRYAAKTTYRGWYRSGMNPKEVKQMLRNREAQGRYVDWDLADGYEVYYYRRKHSLLYA